MSRFIIYYSYSKLLKLNILRQLITIWRGNSSTTLVCRNMEYIRVCLLYTFLLSVYWLFSAYSPDNSPFPIKNKVIKYNKLQLKKHLHIVCNHQMNEYQFPKTARSDHQQKEIQFSFKLNMLEVKCFCKYFHLRTLVNRILFNLTYKHLTETWVNILKW